MKQIRIAMMLALALLYGTGIQAQVVAGGNLNIGTGNVLYSSYGNAIGQYNHSYGGNSLAVGYGDTISDGCPNSFTAGASNKISNSNSFAIGSSVKIFGSRSIGLGYYLKASLDRNAVMGWGIIGNSTHPDKYLENNCPDSFVVGYNSTKPTLTVGPSPNDYPNGSDYELTGKVAIGNVPASDIKAKLHIRSDAGEDAGILLDPTDLERSSTFIHLRDDYHGIEVNNEGKMLIKSETNGQCAPILFKGIIGVNIQDNHVGHINSNYMLWVNGGIIAEKIAIKHYGSSWWPDYVFNTDYKLMPLNVLRDYIGTNHHLPDVPSEAEVLDDGFELGDMQSLLLKKIEELTLYILKQQEEIEILKQTIEGVSEKKNL